jgi:hypothetical protein
MVCIHYRPSSHMAEQRAHGDFVAHLSDQNAPIVFVLTSIAWREAWKYRDRAYRYCLHDIGHAWQELALATRAVGCDNFAVGDFPDDEMAQFCRLNEDEWPMLMVGLRGRSIPAREPDTNEIVWSGGRANQLSNEQVSYPLIDSIHAATKLGGGRSGICAAEPAPVGLGDIHLPAPDSSPRAFGEVVRTRRSVLDFRGGTRSMSFTQLSAILDAAAQPSLADFAATRFVHLYLYVYRVAWLESGVYRHWPESGTLDVIRSGDQRVAAAGLSLGQDLAGNACVAFSIVADIDRAVRAHSDRGYRYVHFEPALSVIAYISRPRRSGSGQASGRSSMTRRIVISVWRQSTSR